MMGTQTINKTPDVLNARLAEYAYTAIRNDILAGRFGSKGRLVQEELAQRLGISRTPVREAIMRLELEGLVTLIPRRGAVVNRVNPQDILDVYEVREELERLAVRLTARKGDVYDVRGLRQILRKMERVGPSRMWEYYKLNRAFHLLMAAASGNVFLVSALESLWDQATNFHLFTMYGTEELRRMITPHEVLVDVAERGDQAEIEMAVSRHIAEARANLLRRLNERA
jgi:DNA-binding GntR family transcriptional regulator